MNQTRDLLSPEATCECGHIAAGHTIATTAVPAHHDGGTGCLVSVRRGDERLRHPRPCDCSAFRQVFIR